MASSGPLYAGTCANDSSYSPNTNPWINPTNAQGSGGGWPCSYNGLLTNSYSDYLKATNFGFSIPAGSTIDGIVVGWGVALSGGLPYSYTNRCRAVKGGTIESTDVTAGTYPSWSGSSPSPTNHGSSTELWGTTWAVDDINASNFGFVLSSFTGGYNAVYCDYCGVTVYYTEAPPSSGTAGMLGVVL